jgi:thioesterase domain-containing protein
VSTAAFLEKLRCRDIEVWAEEGHLRCSAPPGALSSEFREELRQRKAEILKFLETANSLAGQQRAIVPLQPLGTRVPVFATGGHNGDVFCYRALTRHLGEDQPFYGLQPPGLDGHSKPLRRVEDLAAYFAAQIRAFQPNGPRIIAGYCAGGAIAFELARQLLHSDVEVSSVALFGAPYATAYQLASQIRLRLETEWARVARHARALATLSGPARRSYLREKVALRVSSTTNPQSTHPAVAVEVLERRIQVQRATFAALSRYTPGHFAGRLILFLPCEAWAHSSRKPLRWRSMANQCEEHFGPEDCHTDVMLLEPYAPIFAGLFARFCASSLKTELNSSIASPRLAGGVL